MDYTSPLSNYGRENSSGCWGKERVDSKNMSNINLLSRGHGPLAGPAGPLYTGSSPSHGQPPHGPVLLAIVEWTEIFWIARNLTREMGSL
jgi:hypothetical protein